MLAKPIIKFVGGKSQLLPEILPRLPAKIRTYYEPFAGGAAVFFALASERRFERAVLCDLNAELAILYTVVRDAVEALIGELSGMTYSEEEYYRVRATEPGDPVKRAARMVYLNKTGFNGLYRVNKSGKFNVPFGRYANPTICDEPRLRAASEALQGVSIRTGDFWHGCGDAAPGDFVYFDPPYLPVSRTANFRSYQANGFTVEDTQRLAGMCTWLADRGAQFLLSNADTPETREVFGEFQIETVSARRAINRDATKRGAVNEILVSARAHSMVSKETGT